ncbi:hypothetical protein MK079_01415 [Candidatus Gracilibacteria bacterium]|nr:hypothetical protein [Candidatus Gracilibacteria bacterium]
MLILDNNAPETCYQNSDIPDQQDESQKKLIGIIETCVDKYQAPTYGKEKIINGVQYLMSNYGECEIYFPTVGMSDHVIIKQLPSYANKFHRIEIGSKAYHLLCEKFNIESL